MGVKVRLVLRCNLVGGRVTCLSFHALTVNPLKIESMTSPFRLAALLTFLANEPAQTFTNANNFFQMYNSGGCIGFADLDGDGFDDLIVLDQSRNLHTLYQTTEGTFVDFELGEVSGASQWGMCVADFDNDGHKDVFSGGSYDGVFVQHITAPGVSTSMELEEGSMFMQACNWVDIDNDGCSMSLDVMTTP